RHESESRRDRSRAARKSSVGRKGASTECAACAGHDCVLFGRGLHWRLGVPQLASLVLAAVAVARGRRSSFYHPSESGSSMKKLAEACGSRTHHSTREGPKRRL